MREEGEDDRDNMQREGGEDGKKIKLGGKDGKRKSNPEKQVFEILILFK